MGNKILVKHNGDFVEVGGSGGAEEWKATKTYKKDEQVWYYHSDSKSYRYYFSLIDGNIGNTPTDYSDKWGTVGYTSTTGVVGEVIWHAGKTIPSQFLLCDGRAVSRTTYKDLFAVIGTTYGTGDGSTTFNLPNLTDSRFIEGASTPGTKYNAGLPNISGSVVMSYKDYECVAEWNSKNPASGSLYGTENTSYKAKYITQSVSRAEVGGGANTLNFDASKSNSIYGGSTTVQPKALTLVPCIRYKTTVEYVNYSGGPSEWVSTRTYSKHNQVWTYDEASSVYRYWFSTTDNNLNVNPTTDTTGKWALNGSSSISGVVGEIIWYGGTGTPVNFLLCNGGNVSRTTYKELFAVIGTTYGSGDGSTTFTLPNLTDSRFIEGSSTPGTKYSDGLPNITGTIVGNSDNRALRGNDFSKTGAFSSSVTGTSSYAGYTQYTSGNMNIDFKASNSNSIYGNSSVVQPKALTLRPCIRYKKTLESVVDSTLKAELEEVKKAVFDAVYPVGTQIIASTKPTMGTWTEVTDSTGRALWLNSGKTWGNTIARGLPDIQGTLMFDYGSRATGPHQVSDAFTGSNTKTGRPSQYDSNTAPGTVTFKASSYNSIYGASTTVQPNAYTIRMWKRTA